MISPPQEQQRMVDSNIPMNTAPFFTPEGSAQDKDHIRWPGEKQVNQQVDD